MAPSQRTIAAIALLASLVLSGCAARRGGGAAGPVADKPPENTLGGAVFDPPMAAPDFTLTDPEGKPFRLSEQKGKAVLLFFGYTTCPDVCPTTLAELRRVHARLGDAAGRLRVVFVTVDPERDLPARLGEYVRRAGHESFVGLTGARKDLEKVWHDYGVFVEKTPAPESAVGYWVTHSGNTFLIGPDGNLLTSYAFGTQADVIAADLQRVLKKGS